MLLKLMAGLQSLVKGKGREQEEDNDDENSGRPSKRLFFSGVRHRESGRFCSNEPRVRVEGKDSEKFYRKQHKYCMLFPCLSGIH